MNAGLRKFFMNYSVNKSYVKNRATLYPVYSPVENRSLVTSKFLQYIFAHFQNKHKFIRSALNERNKQKSAL